MRIERIRIKLARGIPDTGQMQDHDSNEIEFIYLMNNTMVENRSKKLIEILLDKTEELGARDDAAIDLGEYDDPLTLNALLKIATNPDKDENFLTAACGESIAEILVRTNHFDMKYLEQMVPIARQEAVAVIALNKPEWLKK